MRITNYALIDLLIVVSALFVVVMLVKVSVDPLLEAADRRAMATELRRVQAAIDAYHMLNQMPHVPARTQMRRIVPGDPDAPFSRFLKSPTRYAYRWFKDGFGLHTADSRDHYAVGVAAVASVVRDLLYLPETDRAYAPHAEGHPSAWSRRVETYLQEHIESGNVMGLVNPVSQQETVFNQIGLDQAPGRRPAILITNAPVYSYRYLDRHPESRLMGSIIVFGATAGESVEVFAVSMDGPCHLKTVSAGPGSLQGGLW